MIKNWFTKSLEKKKKMLNFRVFFTLHIVEQIRAVFPKQQTDENWHWKFCRKSSWCLSFTTRIKRAPSSITHYPFPTRSPTNFPSLSPFSPPCSACCTSFPSFTEKTNNFDCNQPNVTWRAQSHKTISTLHNNKQYKQ